MLLLKNHLKNQKSKFQKFQFDFIEVEEKSSDKLIMCLQNSEYSEVQVFQVDFTNIEDSLEDADIEYITTSANEVVEEEEIEDSFV